MIGKTKANSVKNSLSKTDDSVKWFWDSLGAYLETKQLKNTKQRQMIIQKFLDLDTHIEAEKLYESIRKSGSSVGLATIYRTLNLLREAGLVDQKIFSDGRSIFELNHPDSHHDHLICTKCGKIIEFENEKIERIQVEIAKDLNFQMHSHRLDLYGFCATCQ